MQQSGETWKVKIFNRTYWSKATIILERPYWEGPGDPVGWLFKRNEHQISTDARYNDHIKFLERVG